MQRLFIVLQAGHGHRDSWEGENLRQKEIQKIGGLMIEDFFKFLIRAAVPWVFLIVLILVTQV